MFFTIKLYLHLNCVLMVNWIVWNRTILLKIELVLNNLHRLICHKTQPTNQLNWISWNRTGWLNWIAWNRNVFDCPVCWGYRIHRLLLCRGLNPPHRMSWIWHKQSDGEVPAMLELWGMRSTCLLPSLPGPLWPGVVAPDIGPIYGLNRTKLCFLYYIDFYI